MHSDFAPFLAQTRPLLFRTLPIPPALRVAVLAPHPDDFDAIGITMRVLHENGNPIDLAVLTSGASGVQDDFALQGKASLREQEQRASCRFFGLAPEHLTFLRMEEDPQGHLIDSEQNFARLKSCWDAHRPELVFLPHGNDTNADHQRTYLLFRRILEEEPRSVLALLNRDPKTIAMRPDIYTLFDESEAQWKGELLRFHRSQHERNLRTRRHGFDERILHENRRAAGELRGEAAFAEVFELEWHAGKPGS